MSKLITDSETLMHLLEPGVDPEDNLVCMHMRQIRELITANAMAAAKDKLDNDGMSAHLFDAANVTLTDLYQLLQGIRDDFADMLSKKGGTK